MVTYMAFTLIKNCRLIDGSGTSGIKSDLIISGDKIAAVGSYLPKTGVKTIINAGGKVLVPGFIDTHTHSDISILATPEATGKISQGVTTDIIGNCGLSVFPVSNLNRDHLTSLYKNYDVDIFWDDLNGYKQELQRRQPAINIATLCGHNSLRASTLGYENVAPTSEQLHKMQQKLADSLSAGAKGISTGLLYTPGKFALPGELSHLLAILPRFRAVYATNIRSEGDQLIESVTEAVSLARSSKLSHFHISHLKASQPRNWDKLDKVLDILRQERANDLQVTADRYPYVESMTQLSIMLPAPYDSMPDARIEQELKDNDKFDLLVKELAEYQVERWGNVRLVSTAYDKLISFIGQPLSEIAEQVGVPPFILCAEAVRSNSTGTMAAFSGMSDGNLKKILASDFVCCGSDESARPQSY